MYKNYQICVLYDLYIYLNISIACEIIKTVFKFLIIKKFSIY